METRLKSSNIHLLGFPEERNGIERMVEDQEVKKNVSFQILKKSTGRANMAA